MHSVAYLANVAVGVSDSFRLVRRLLSGVHLVPLITHYLHVVLQQPSITIRYDTVEINVRSKVDGMAILI